MAFESFAVQHMRALLGGKRRSLLGVAKEWYGSFEPLRQREISRSSRGDEKLWELKAKCRPNYP
jgi:hypothetical protein